MKRVIIAASVALASAAGVTSAAVDGTNGATSTGTTQVQLVKGDSVRVSDLNDFNFGSGTTVPPKQTDDICIYSTTGSYTITASSNGNVNGGTQFHMLSATSTETVRYLVEFRDDTFSQNGDNLLHNTASSTYSNADTVSDNCSGGVNSRIIIEIQAASFNAATPDTYTDTLTLLVQPV